MQEVRQCVVKNELEKGQVKLRTNNKGRDTDSLTYAHFLIPSVFGSRMAGTPHPGAYPKKHHITKADGVMIVLAVIVVGLIIFIVLDTTVIRNSFPVNAKVAMMFKGCPTILPVAVMGEDGSGSRNPSAQDRTDISMCEGSNCTGFYGINSSWVQRMPHINENSTMQSGVNEAARKFTECASDGDCVNFITCDVTDPEQVVKDPETGEVLKDPEGRIMSSNCPARMTPTDGSTPTTQEGEDINSIALGRMWGGPSGCPLYDTSGSPVSNLHVPCIQGKCGMWVPDYYNEAKGPVTTNIGPQESCFPETDKEGDAYKLSSDSGRWGSWSVDSETIFRAWNQEVSENNAPKPTPLFVPCSKEAGAATGTCKLYGEGGVASRMQLQECDPSDSTTCPTGMTCQNCTSGDGSNGCPDAASWSLPDGSTSGNICVGRTTPSSMILSDFRAEGVITGKGSKPDTFNVQWTRVQCQWKYRKATQGCRLIKSSDNEDLWPMIFGSDTTDPTGHDLIKTSPPEDNPDNYTGVTTKDSWGLVSVDVPKASLVRIMNYSIQHLNQSQYPPLKPGKCTPTNGPFGDGRGASSTSSE